MNYPNASNNFQQEHAMRLFSSFKHLLARDLIKNYKNDYDIARQLFHAPFALVSHNTDSDPIFNYANLKALEIFELSWEEYTQTPSRLSAEPINQAERDRLLALVTNNGYIDHYSGVRISKTGKRFRIKKAIVWNIIADNVYTGQAACFEEWAFI